jgi:hypothetical protein
MVMLPLLSLAVMTFRAAGDRGTDTLVLPNTFCVTTR